MRLALAFLAAVAPAVATSSRTLDDSAKTGVAAAASSATFDFVTEVEPLFVRQGCASAYCHGSATGRGGFKLSLFGTDPRADHRAVTEELGGRRVDLAVPENSLLLKKPSLRMSHGGGRRLPADDAAYGRLRSWIAAGAPFSRGAERTVAKLELRPARDGFRAVATFASPEGDVGDVRDVTDLAVFQSSDEAVATVDRDGKVAATGRGEAWIFARFGHLDARAAVLRPFGDGGGATAATHPLDRVWSERLRELGLAPAPPAPPHTLVRRLYLDLAGRPPAPDEIRTFLALPAATRTAATAGLLLESPAFDAVLVRHLARWLEVPDADPEGDQGRGARLRRFLQDSVAKRRPLTELARAVIVEDHGFLGRFSDPRDRAEFVGRAFLGVRIGCARCHDHPLDRWQQRDHLAFSAFFADPRPAPEGGTRAGVFFHPETGEPVTPGLLPTGSPPPPAELRGRARVGWFVADSGAASLARAFANRVFAAFVGRGLVEPQDDHRLSNPAVHEPLLDALAAHLRASGTDLRELVRLVVTSQVYAAASEPGAGGPADPLARFLARREARPMSPALLEASISFVLAGGAVALPRAPLARELSLRNGAPLQAALAGATFGGEGSPADRLSEIWLRFLARPPRDEESAEFLPLLEASAKDIAFALVASREFGSIR